jgi:hypothetical protein
VGDAHRTHGRHRLRAGGEPETGVRSGVAAHAQIRGVAVEGAAGFYPTALDHANRYHHQGATTFGARGKSWRGGKPDTHEESEEQASLPGFAPRRGSCGGTWVHESASEQPPCRRWSVENWRDCGRLRGRDGEAVRVPTSRRPGGIGCPTAEKEGARILRRVALGPTMWVRTSDKIETGVPLPAPDFCIRRR